MPICENIRAPRSGLAPTSVYLGYIPSERAYFHGLKLHVVCSDNQFITEVILRPGSIADLEGLYQMPLALPEGSELYVDQGYTDYQTEEDVQAGEGVVLRPIRKRNSKRYQQA